MAYRDDRPVPLSKSCQMVGGRNANPQNFMADWDVMSVRDCRLGPNRKQNHRIAPEVKPTGGKIDGAKRGAAHINIYSRRDLRGFAIRVLRDRGEAINEQTIKGILSGRTL